jgi:hypothetical protein
MKHKLCSRNNKKFRVQIYFPFWTDKVMRDLHRWKWQLFSDCRSSIDTKTCYLTLRFAAERLMSINVTVNYRAQHLNGLLTVLKKIHILDTQQCRTITTLSDHIGKQIIRATTQKWCLQDFQTMFIGGLVSNEKQCVNTHVQMHYNM